MYVHLPFIAYFVAVTRYRTKTMIGARFASCRHRRVIVYVPAVAAARRVVFLPGTLERAGRRREVFAAQRYYFSRREARRRRKRDRPARTITSGFASPRRLLNSRRLTIHKRVKTRWLFIGTYISRDLLICSMHRNSSNGEP